MIGVVDDRMLDFVAQDCLADVVGLLSVVELGRMDPDHDQFVRKRPLQLFQLRQDVHAVDAAIGPEIEQDEFALQVGLRQRGSVQPRDVLRELRNLQPTREGIEARQAGIDGAGSLPAWSETSSVSVLLSGSHLFVPAGGAFSGALRPLPRHLNPPFDWLYRSPESMAELQPGRWRGSRLSFAIQVGRRRRRRDGNDSRARGNGRWRLSATGDCNRGHTDQR